MPHSTPGLLTLLVCVLALAACAAPSSPTASEGAPGFAPTPYTAEQIRAANPPGTVLVYALRDESGAEVTSTFEFGESDADGVLFGGAVRDASGTLLRPSQATRVRWADLRDHARFPAAHCTRSDAAVTTRAGRFDCWLYTLTDPDDGSVRRFWFAKQRAGSPVLHTTERDGVEVQRMELVELRPAR